MRVFFWVFSFSGRPPGLVLTSPGFFHFNPPTFSVGRFCRVAVFYSRALHDIHRVCVSVGGTEGARIRAWMHEYGLGFFFLFLFKLQGWMIGGGGLIWSRRHGVGEHVNECSSGQDAVVPSKIREMRANQGTRPRPFTRVCGTVIVTDCGGVCATCASGLLASRTIFRMCFQCLGAHSTGRSCVFF